MLIEESKWIQSTLESEFDASDYPLLNIGSSRLVFRTETQPHIHNNIFAPLLEKGYKVIHADIKDDEGVDLVGDLNDPDFRKKLTQLGVKSVLCSSLLEHLINPQLICDSILNLLSSGDKILVTVPHTFPFHNDPIDTMLRPNIEELAFMFPDTEIVKAEVVSEAHCFWDDLKANKRLMMIMIVRWALPFYKHSEWKYMIKDLFRLRKKLSVTAMVLKKL